MAKNQLLWALILPAIVVTILITSNITKNINKDVTEDVTNSFINQLIDSCGNPISEGGAGFTGVQLQRCQEKMAEGANLKNIKFQDCRGCGKTEFGENQLCLIGEDALFCEKSIPLIEQRRTQGIAKVGSQLQSFTDFIDQFTQNQILIGIAILFIIGLFIGMKKR